MALGEERDRHPPRLDRPGCDGAGRGHARGPAPALGLSAAGAARGSCPDRPGLVPESDRRLSGGRSSGEGLAAPVRRSKRTSCCDASYLDLVGLPPTREELHDFRADQSPGAYEKVVDRLLASPRYGERWGRHWMDVWRYSDWYGLGEEARYSHPHIWQWRDWIVAALNADKGYDRMIVEMLAGDELTPDDPATVRATGFLVRNWDIFNRNTWLANTVEHTARAFLGVTIQCARCHDHKFDPISQSDYYRLRAFFEPYHIRIDRVPGQPDRAKAGLPRAFDDFLDTPTFLFIRGDETRPDKRPLTPATPAVLGGEVRIVPVPLADSLRHSPDKRDFVIREAIEAGEQAIRGARAARCSGAARTWLRKRRRSTTAVDSRATQPGRSIKRPSARQSDAKPARQQAIAGGRAAGARAAGGRRRPQRAGRRGIGTDAGRAAAGRSPGRSPRRAA